MTEDFRILIEEEKFLHAAGLAAVLFKGDPYKRFEHVDRIANEAFEAGRIDEAQDICERYPGDVSPEIGWRLDAFILDIMRYVVETELTEDDIEPAESVAV